MAKNDDIRRMFDLHQVDWIEVAEGLDMPLTDFARMMNKKSLSPALRRRVVSEIKKIHRRWENFYRERR